MSMNLSSMIDEGSFKDARLDETSTFDPGTMPADIETQMEIQNSDLPSKVKDEAAQSRPLKLKISRLFMEGNDKKIVASVVKSKFINIPSNFNKLLDESNGLVGTVLVDCSALASSEDYAALKSKFRMFHKFAFKCSCPQCEREASTQEIISSGNIDSFFGSKVEKKASVKLCRKTGLPVLENPSLFTASDAADTAKLLVANKLAKASDIKGFLTQEKPLMAVKKMFAGIFSGERKAEAAKYTATVSNSEFIVKKAAFDFEFNKPVDNKPVNITGIKPINPQVELEVAVVPLEIGLQETNEPAAQSIDRVVTIGEVPQEVEFDVEELNMEGADQLDTGIIVDQAPEIDKSFDTLAIPVNQLSVEIANAPKPGEMLDYNKSNMEAEIGKVVKADDDVVMESDSALDRVAWNYAKQQKSLKMSEKLKNEKLSVEFAPTTAKLKVDLKTASIEAEIGKPIKAEAVFSTPTAKHMNLKAEDYTQQVDFGMGDALDENPFEFELDKAPVFESLDVDTESALDGEWFEKEEMPVEINGKGQGELKVNPNNEFDF